MSCSVTVAGRLFEGDEEYCRGVFATAVLAAKRSAPFAVSPDEMVWLSAGSEIVIRVPSGFDREADHAAQYDAVARAGRWERLG